MTTAAESPAAVSRAQRLWAVLLVLDSFFVIIFGGALAAKLYQHWHAPAEPQRRAARAPRETPRPPAPKAAEPAPMPPNAPPKGRQDVAAPAPTSSNKPLTKPSLLQDAPKRRETPTLKNGSANSQGTATTATTTTPKAAEAANAASAATAAKAIPTEFKIKAPGAKSVELAGAFLVRTGGVKSMLRRDGDLWTLRLYLTPNTYRYHFLVDGKKTLDPENSQSEKGYSVLAVAPQQP